MRLDKENQVPVVWCKYLTAQHLRGLMLGFSTDCCLTVAVNRMRLICVVKVPKNHDKCRVSSRDGCRGPGPDRTSQDCGDSEEDLQRWLTPLFLTFSWRSSMDTSFFVLVFSPFFKFWLEINALLDQLFWVREEAVVLGSLPKMIPFKRWL